jgi:hypothetical protein
MSDPASQDRVTIQLDRDLVVSFFERSYQFMTDNNPTFQHPADAIAVDELSSELERALAEPFKPDYTKLLADARSRALKRYKERMGDEHARWLDELDYQQGR